MYSDNGMLSSPQNIKWVRNLGAQMVQSVEFSIGGQVVDRIGSDYLDIRQVLWERNQAEKVFKMRKMGMVWRRRRRKVCHRLVDVVGKYNAAL